MPSNPNSRYSSMISSTRSRLASVVVIRAPTLSAPKISFARRIPATASSWLFPPGLGRFVLCRSAGPSSEVESSMLFALQNARMASFKSARFDAMTKSTFLPVRALAAATIVLISGKLRSGSPP